MPSVFFLFKTVGDVGKRGRLPLGMDVLCADGALHGLVIVRRIGEFTNEWCDRYGGMTQSWSGKSTFTLKKKNLYE